MQLRGMHGGIAAMALLWALAGPVRADTHTWVLCTPSSFHSCNSVALITTPLMTGATRTGTLVTIMVANLQGSNPHDNTAWSYLWLAQFWSNASTPISVDRYESGTDAGTLEGATGTGTTADYNDGDATLQDGTYVTAKNFAVAGCNQGSAPVSTCGAGQFVSFSWTSNGIFDARNFNTVEIAVWGANFAYDQCESDPSALKYAPTYYTRCDDLSESSTTDVAPEPTSLALIGTGLFGIAGAGLRRRRRGAR